MDWSRHPPPADSPLVGDERYDDDPESSEVEDQPAEAGGLNRPWVGIQFDCCGAYARVYRDRRGKAYIGRCPQCHRQVRLRVGPDGTTSRFFRAH